MDRIIVNTNADMQRVLDWSAELRGLAIELPFTEGEIEFREEELLVKFREQSHGILEMSLWMCKNDMKWGKDDPDWIKVVEWTYDLESDVLPELHINAEGQKKIELAMLLTQDDTVGKCIRKFRGIMLFSAYYREEVTRTRTVSRVGTGKPSKPGKRSNTRRLTVRRYTISSDMLGELPAPKKMWKGYAESFGVRGHYRRYQSGKVVWVRPYTKKGRMEKKGDTTYVL